MVKKVLEQWWPLKDEGEDRLGKSGRTPAGMMLMFDNFIEVCITQNLCFTLSISGSLFLCVCIQREKQREIIKVIYIF